MSIPSADLQVRLACPQCGAAGDWSLLQTLRLCPYCTSVLWWPNDPGVRECFMVQDMAPRPEDALDVLRTTDALREHARLRGLSEGGWNEEGEAMGRVLAEALTPEVETIKQRRAALFSLRESATVHVPYLMVYMLLAYHALGRTRGSGPERKVFRPFHFSLDTVLPAYPEPWNFRDRGLWFSRQSLLPLDEAVLASGSVMGPAETLADPQKEARPWLGRRQLLTADLQPIAFGARVALSFLWWIFRPFHCVLADTPAGRGWFLVDGQFRTLAGYLSDEEAARVVARDWPPVDLERFQRPRVRPFPCRCPVCAGTLTLNERGAQLVCPTCGRLLEPTPDGFRPRPYLALRREDLPWSPGPGGERTAWVPFWRLSGRWKIGEEGFPDLEALAARALPRAAARRPHDPPLTRSLYFPAFDGWLYDQYDTWCLRTSEALGASAAEPGEARFHQSVELRRGDLLVPPSQDAGIYESQIDALVPGLLPPALQARLDAATVRRLQEARFTIERRDLVFVPIPLGMFGDLPDRLLGPGCAVDSGPLVTGAFPPVLYRNVRRWKERTEPSRNRKSADPGNIFTRPLR